MQTQISKYPNNHNTVCASVCVQMKGVNVEAVLRVEEDEEDGKRKNASRQMDKGNLGLSMLIDSQNNQYVLTKPRDSTIPRADHHFIKVTSYFTLKCTHFK